MVMNDDTDDCRNVACRVEHHRLGVVGTSDNTYKPIFLTP